MLVSSILSDSSSERVDLLILLLQIPLHLVEDDWQVAELVGARFRTGRGQLPVVSISSLRLALHLHGEIRSEGEGGVASSRTLELAEVERAIRS